MGHGKGKTEGGQGGKLGHSNMDYWGSNDEAKDDSRKRRRLRAKELIRKGRSEMDKSYGED